jgi:hypothetical protein
VDGEYASAIANCQGIATWDETNQKYWIISCTVKARRINFTLTAPMSGNVSNAATVNSYADGYNPGATADVYDVAELFGRALAMANGVATWNEESGYYEVIECDQLAILIQGTLASDLTGGSGSVTFGSVLSPTPFGQAPTDTTLSVDNPFGFYAKSGAACLVVPDSAGTGWVLAFVAPVEVDVVTTVAWSSPNLTQATTPILAWKKGPEGSPTTILTGTTCSGGS